MASRKRSRPLGSPLPRRGLLPGSREARWRGLGLLTPPPSQERSSPVTGARKQRLTRESMRDRVAAAEIERDVNQHLAILELENEQLRRALTSRIVIEQAKGVLSVRLDVTVEEAFEVLRSRARSTRRRLHDVAQEVVDAKGGCLADWARWRSARDVPEARGGTTGPSRST